MKTVKSHFLKFNKRQRNGILFLTLLIVIAQIGYFFMDFSSNELGADYQYQDQFFNTKIDSIKLVAGKQKNKTSYRFNPNFLTDFRASKLGLSIAEIDRLFAYRKTGKYVNSAKEFQKVTKISDSLLDKIKSLFKFPSWVNKPKKNAWKTYDKSKPNEPIVVQDINKVTAIDLQKVNGIGETLSKRIIKYRTKLKGFYFKDQLKEVYGLSPEVIDKIHKRFQILSKPKIKKININEATFKQVLHLPYMNYELTKKIFNYRDEFAEIQSLEELKKIDGFSIDKYNRIILYLSTE